MRQLILTCLFATFAVGAGPRLALADPQPPRAESPAPPPPASAPLAPTDPLPPAATPTWRTTGTWGWFVLGTGVAAGVALATYGLTFDCGDYERSCQRRASIAIWGGLGIAALSTAIGISIVQSGRKHVTVAPTASADGRSPGGGVVLRGSF